MSGPLHGVKVVELGVWVAGPAAAGVLGDWGADVIKIEPLSGDPRENVSTDVWRRYAKQSGVRIRQSQ